MITKISDESKKKYPFPDEYAQLEGFAEEYEKRRIKGIIKVPEKHKQAIGQNGLIYCSRLFQKSRALYKGFIDNISANNLSVLFLIGRSHLETTCALGYFVYNLNKYYSGQITVEEIDSLLYNLFAGFKDVDFREKHPGIDCPKSVNILTMIEKTDKLLPSLYEKVRKDSTLISMLYTKLSEVCHPNSMGLVFGIKVIEKRRLFFSENISLEPIKQFSSLLGIMILSCEIYFTVYDNCLSLLSKHEQMPRLLK